ncbi:ABC transporter substrate-binding protein [Allokutzneria sp. A3M-2-11 16]|uniref:ABC transporter substrate-binding protein n=1 Tax=Allokutzneria sp. A3M-2-11 16 TaxID=2962043 RepID=UPI0020B65662|nr:ABC transporter substrate-binding protein [Allokutzneria sp. A3M-2-11 16]MCP3801292.1 ABC transporter substrate-binding protein [Allokutzneria sp. A3M-2-11 16]
MPLSRRALLRSAGLAFGTATLLGGCGPSTPASAPVENTAGRVPRKGGSLRAVFTGGGTADTLDPFGSASPVDFVRNDVLYDVLFSIENGRATPRLALAAEPAPDGRSFVLRLRDGVVWHDGSPFTANDVAYSFRYMSAPERPMPSELQSYFDLGKVAIRDVRTLVVPTRQPIGDPALIIAAFLTKVIKDGATSFTPTTAVGTGSYRVTAFEPGREARLTRFDRYWDGAGAVDELVVLSLSDPQAKVNAVRTGQADYAGDIPFSMAKAGSGSPDVEVRTAGRRHRVGFGFVLNATIAPFNDPRARRAVRLAVDRKSLVDSVLLGYGEPGNDLYGFGTDHFAEREPLRRDVDQARKLLREAGAEGASITIRSTEYEVGYNASTQLLAEQLREVGLKVKPDIVGVAEFFEPRALAASNGVTFSIGALPLPVIYARLAAYPSLALNDRELNDAIAAGLAAVDDTARRRAWTTVQDVMSDRGNTIVWGLADTLSLERKAVAGVEVRGLAKYPYLGKAGLA